MERVLLNSKLHRLHVTQVELDYEGSCALDTDFIKAAKMTEYERVEIYNVTNGERFSTYLIAAEAGSKTVSINGAAAHKANPNDIIIICSYISMTEGEISDHSPTLVYFNESNKIVDTKSSIPTQRLRSL
ncbi:MAG: aspartate 1-decarboxylase [SAR86 cluster bacterium]|uniref:Aspartate 1-decarboxylase n=1 Tax=SAR86 cluster bacterium TaxID=2030880 RepID=A0A368BIS1_9GAMM|nr:aspartate 1-decarboxylase [Gammaproteobacteria bacterium]RCL37200.1 MAG: aspartate 1-decarboxylase [SAR86 cluster bacterium]|tara:strand:+ start:971 stop:1360 length:390 start_codon:yes stop_codon:yes gene_type:complete